VNLEAGETFLVEDAHIQCEPVPAAVARSTLCAGKGREGFDAAKVYAGALE
jgi:hypothetical protein